jgi:catechol 2,3-dioxygenase-like lactoylglutathione lyase family enzyme
MEPKQSSFGKAIPILASLDIARTLTFFREALGFRTSHLESFSYGTAVRDAVEIHFWLCNDKHIVESTSCYVRVDDIDALHAELASKLPDLQDVAKTAWGMDELYVVDPDGNLIKFGQSRADAVSSGSHHP